MIVTYIEIREGKIKKSSLEALGEASRRAAELGLPAAAVVVGAGLDALASELAAAGAAKVFLLDNPGLAAYAAPAYAAVLADWARAAAPAAVFFPATAMGKDLAPRLAARLGVAMASDCVKVEVRDGRLVFTRPIYAGKAFLTAWPCPQPPPSPRCGPTSLRRPRGRLGKPSSKRPARSSRRPSSFPPAPRTGGWPRSWAPREPSSTWPRPRS